MIKSPDAPLKDDFESIEKDIEKYVCLCLSIITFNVLNFFFFFLIIYRSQNQDKIVKNRPRSVFGAKPLPNLPEKKSIFIIFIIFNFYKFNFFYRFNKQRPNIWKICDTSITKENNWYFKYNNNNNNNNNNFKIIILILIFILIF